MEQRASPSDTIAPARELPKRMHAVAIDRFGGPEVLVYRELLTPRPGADDVLIALHTAGVGGWDAWHRAGGDAPARPRFPLILGVDGAGSIAACGAKVRRFHEGDEVIAYDYERRGFYAEYVAVAADHVGRRPAALGLGDAGAIPCIGLTALQGIDDALHIKQGESVVVHGASGGVGHLAVQFAKLRGARVLASASGEDGATLARQLGADESIDGKRVDVAAAAQRFAPEGIDAVIALIGGDALQRLMTAVRDNGRVAHPNGVEPVPRATRGIEIVAYDAIAGVREFERLDRAVDEAKLKVHIGAEFPLAEAARAHQRLAAGHLLGKMVLRVA
jgi:NADPH:quinone reductase-like Zn-dependent oxidoreductase